MRRIRAADPRQVARSFIPLACVEEIHKSPTLSGEHLAAKGLAARYAHGDVRSRQRTREAPRQCGGGPGRASGLLPPLPEHDLFVITEGHRPEQPGPITFTKDTPLRLRQIEMEGAWHYPVFTSVERISAVMPQTVGFVAMQGRVLLGLLRENNVILNPGSPYGKFLTPHEISGILDGSIFEPQARPQFAPGEEILLGEPADYPHHLVEPLEALLRHLPRGQAGLSGARLDPRGRRRSAAHLDWDRRLRQLGEGRRRSRSCDQRSGTAGRDG